MTSQTAPRVRTPNETATGRRLYGRPHVEYIQAQQLDWQRVGELGLYPHLGSDVLAKVLSQDAETGAASVLLRLPAGWMRGCQALDAQCEFFVLAGELQLNGQRLGLHHYGFLPAGVAQKDAAAPKGADLLVFYDRTPRLQATASAGAGAACFLNCFDMPWTADNIDPAYGDLGLRKKVLYRNEATQDATILVAVPPHFHPAGWQGHQERHDCVEEMFLLSGDLMTDRGPMLPGAYFWRPPHLAHGPFATCGGNMGIYRMLGANLVNNWTEHTRTIDISGEPYDPVIGDARLAHLPPFVPCPAY